MSSTTRASDTNDSTLTIRAIGETIRGSVLLLLAVAGALLILLGYVLQTGVWAAIVATWGVALVGVGLLGYLLVQWKRQ